MAIVKCKECGADMSTKAVTCPLCGCSQPREAVGCFKVVMVSILGFILFAALLPFVGERPETTARSAPADRVLDPRSKVSSGIFEADNRSDFPKLARKLGSSWARLQPTREAAALHVAKNDKCDYVEVAEASDRSTSKDIVIFVDCRNGERQYVSESSLASGQDGAFQSDKTVGKDSAIEACRRSAKSMTMYPELAEMNLWSGSSFSANRSTGNARVLLDFNSKNAFGVERKFTATCIFQADGGTAEIKIKIRE